MVHKESYDFFYLKLPLYDSMNVYVQDICPERIHCRNYHVIGGRSSFMQSIDVVIIIQTFVELTPKGSFEVIWLQFDKQNSCVFKDFP